MHIHRSWLTSTAASHTLFHPSGFKLLHLTIMQFGSTSQHGWDHKWQTENNDHQCGQCGLDEANRGWMWLFLFICFLLGPSSSQLSAWQSGGGSLPQYIWILRLFLFGYESWILSHSPQEMLGASCYGYSAQKDTLWDKFDQWDRYFLTSFTFIDVVLVCP